MGPGEEIAYLTYAVAKPRKLKIRRTLWSREGGNQARPSRGAGGHTDQLVRGRQILPPAQPQLNAGDAKAHACALLF